MCLVSVGCHYPRKKIWLEKFLGHMCIIHGSGRSFLAICVIMHESRRRVALPPGCVTLRREAGEVLGLLNVSLCTKAEDEVLGLL